LEEYDMSSPEYRKLLKSYGLITEEETEERIKNTEKEAIRKMFSKNMSVDTIAAIYPKELVLEVQAEIAKGKA
jgi:hypothetical protein